MVSSAAHKGGIAQMTEKERGSHQSLSRWLAVAALIGIYFLSAIGIVMTTAVTSAQARGRGGGRGFARGGGRGFVRGRGRGVGVYYGGYDSCWWSPRYRRWVCPYYY